MRTIVLLLLCLLSVSATAAISVMDHGASGDGVTDDTAAFQDALIAARALGPGGTAHVPPGRYRLTDSLELDSVLLHGTDEGGWNSDEDILPVLLINHNQGPAVIFRGSASIHGLHFFYLGQSPVSPIAWSPTILLEDGRPSITNIKITNTWHGVATAPGANTGRLHMANVFIVNAYHVGVDIEGGWDIPTMENIEVWNPAMYAQEHCTGFRFGHNDGMRARNLFVFRCKTGFEFYRSSYGGRFWGELAGCGTDQAITAIHVHDADQLAITGGYHLCHVNGLIVDASQARVAVSGGTWKTNAGPILRVEQARQLAFTGVVSHRGMELAQDQAHIVLNGGNAIAITGCSLLDNAPGIDIGPGVGLLALHGNVIDVSGFPPVIDRREPSTLLELSH